MTNQSLYVCCITYIMLYLIHSIGNVSSQLQCFDNWLNILWLWFLGFNLNKTFQAHFDKSTNISLKNFLYLKLHYFCPFVGWYIFDHMELLIFA